MILTISDFNLGRLIKQKPKAERLFVVLRLNLD